MEENNTNEQSIKTEIKPILKVFYRKQTTATTPSGRGEIRVNPRVRFIDREKNQPLHTMFQYEPIEYDE